MSSNRTRMSTVRRYRVLDPSPIADPIDARLARVARSGLMRASIVIAAHEEGDLLVKTVESCLETIDDLDCEIVVADDASADGSVEGLRRRFGRGGRGGGGGGRGGGRARAPPPPPPAGGGPPPPRRPRGRGRGRPFFPPPS